MDYIGIVTDFGRNVILEAISTNSSHVIDHIGYGDGLGAEYTPVSSQTALKHQLGVLSSISRDVEDGWVFFSSTIPANVPTFTLRELGLFDADNNLIVIANTQEVTKPTSVSGAAVSLPVSIGISISNGSVLVVEIAEGEDYPTKSWVLSAVHAIHTIDGGTF